MTKEDSVQVVVMLPRSVVKLMDHWGIDQGFKSRAEAVAELIVKGLGNYVYPPPKEG